MKLYRVRESKTKRDLAAAYRGAETNTVDFQLAGKALTNADNGVIDEGTNQTKGGRGVGIYYLLRNSQGIPVLLYFQAR